MDDTFLVKSAKTAWKNNDLIFFTLKLKAEKSIQEFKDGILKLQDALEEYKKRDFDSVSEIIEYFLYWLGSPQKTGFYSRNVNEYNFYIGRTKNSKEEIFLKYPNSISIYYKKVKMK